MKAVILVGGEGTRLRPLTWRRPKAIVPILNRPFLEYLVGYLKEHGITEVILAMGYLPDPIQECLGDGSKLGVRLHYVVEDSPMGTSGAVKNAEQFLDERFLVFNGDILTGIDLSDMIRHHLEGRVSVSIALTPVDNPTIYGVIETDEKSRVRRFVEKPGWDEVTTNMINAGIYVIEPEILDRIPASRPSMFEHDIFPSLLDDDKPMLGYPSDAYWIDIGTPEKYLQAHHDLLLERGDEYIQTDGTSEIEPDASIRGPVMIAGSCVIAKSARITGPAVLGEGCHIGGGTRIEGSILWDGVRAGERSQITNSVIGTRSHIGGGCYIPSGCVLGDEVHMEPGYRIPEGTKVEPAEHLG
ncbi:MAG: NDP-sugar synthase [Dehalococcoidales bacterium]